MTPALRITGILLCTVLILPIPSSAQEPLRAGTRVRLTLLSPRGDDSPRTIIGRLGDVGDSAFILLDPRGRPQAFERAAIVRMERSQGRRSRWRLTGIGFAVGFGAGAVAGASTGGCRSKYGFGPCFTEGEAAAILGVFFGGIGAGVGAILPPGERWTVVPLAPPPRAD